MLHADIPLHQTTSDQQCDIYIFFLVSPLNVISYDPIHMV